jgi:hypothetical protein
VVLDGQRGGDRVTTLLADDRLAQDEAGPVLANKPTEDADISIDSFAARIMPTCRETEKIQYPNRFRVIPRLNNVIQMQSW